MTNNIHTLLLKVLSLTAFATLSLNFHLSAAPPKLGTSTACSPPGTPALHSPQHRVQTATITRQDLLDKVVCQSIFGSSGESGHLKISDDKPRFQPNDRPDGVTLNNFLGKYDVDFTLKGDSLVMDVDAQGRQWVTPEVFLQVVRGHAWHIKGDDNDKVKEFVYLEGDTLKPVKQGISYLPLKQPMGLIVTRDNPNDAEDIFLRFKQDALFLMECRGNGSQMPSFYGAVVLSLFRPTGMHNYVRMSDGQQFSTPTRLVKGAKTYNYWVEGNEMVGSFKLTNMCGEGWTHQPNAQDVDPSSILTTDHQYHTHGTAFIKIGLPEGVCGVRAEEQPVYYGHTRLGLKKEGYPLIFTDSLYAFAPNLPYAYIPSKDRYLENSNKMDGYYYVKGPAAYAKEDGSIEITTQMIYSRLKQISIELLQDRTFPQQYPDWEPGNRILNGFPYLQNIDAGDRITDYWVKAAGGTHELHVWPENRCYWGLKEGLETTWYRTDDMPVYHHRGEVITAATWVTNFGINDEGGVYVSGSTGKMFRDISYYYCAPEIRLFLVPGRITSVTQDGVEIDPETGIKGAVDISDYVTDFGAVLPSDWETRDEASKYEYLRSYYMTEYERDTDDGFMTRFNQHVTAADMKRLGLPVQDDYTLFVKNFWHNAINETHPVFAALTPITKEAVTTDLGAMFTDKTPVEIGRYDISGRAVGASTPGLHIVRYSDGSTRKILVK